MNTSLTTDNNLYSEIQQLLRANTKSDDGSLTHDYYAFAATLSSKYN